MKAQYLNVGVIGIGRMGQRHAMNFLRMVPSAELLCVCSPVQEELKWAEENLAPFGVKAYATIEDMLASPGLQAVIIASPTAMHMTHTLAALDHGLHVLCEKPICTSISELNTLCDRIDSNPEVTVMVGFMRRFDENYQDAYTKIQSGLIGEPYLFRSQGCEKLDTSPFFHEYLKRSGGIFMDAAIHDIDLSLMFLGEDVVPKSISAVGTSIVFSERSEVGDADNTIAICEFWGGKIAYFYHSRTAAHGYDNVSEIIGKSGKIAINTAPRQNRVDICDSLGVRMEPTPSWYDRYKSAFVTEANAWVDAILNKKPLPIPLRSALKSLMIAQSLQESLKTGLKINFDELGNRIE